MGEIGGGDDKIVAEFVDHMRQFVVEGAEDNTRSASQRSTLARRLPPNAADFWPAVFPSSLDGAGFSLANEHSSLTQPV